MRSAISGTEQTLEAIFAEHPNAPLSSIVSSMYLRKMEELTDVELRRCLAASLYAYRKRRMKNTRFKQLNATKIPALFNIPREITILMEELIEADVMGRVKEFDQD